MHLTSLQVGLMPQHHAMFKYIFPGMSIPVLPRKCQEVGPLHSSWPSFFVRPVLVSSFILID